jgi:DNA-binding NtrC family response regulator
MFPKILLILGSVDAQNDLSLESEWQELLADNTIINRATLADALATITSERVDCVLALHSAADEMPADILEAIQAVKPSLPVIFRRADITAFTAGWLVRAGAAHCLSEGDGIDRLRETIENSIQYKKMQDQVRNDRNQASEPWRTFLIGDSPAMEAVAEKIRLVGPRRCTVLITGETGTGKEMAARALHSASPRSRHPMVAINCSALPENLLEAELFGHTKGAFTGAANLRIGRFEQAHQGTIFLDEIGDMPLELQAKLLRVLQDREVQRLGSSETIKIDVRVIAATNIDLQERVKQGTFRADLFYRLNVVPLQMPPLTSRTTDIPMLASHFVQKVCLGEDLPLKRLSPEALCRLCASPWPGNVRQLENSVEMAVAISGDRDVLLPKDFGLTDSGPRSTMKGVSAQYPLPISGPVHFDTAVSQFEMAMLDSALRQSGGNKTVAASRLGIKRTTLIMKMRSFENSGFLQKAG